ncbi:MAG: hypothetical protein RIR11_567 [Bacteroidota bacterium]|jgi:hypothetical protein
MRLYILSLFLVLSFGQLVAQLPASCNGTASAIACDITCISCNFNGFSGSTEGYPSGVAPEFCGTVENVQWLGFIAGAAEATFKITPSNCVNGNGVQVALYNDCQLPPLACDKGEMDGGNLPVSITVPMLVGANYYLLVDGYAGDQCQFTVSVEPPQAVFEPPLSVVSLLTGPSAMCPNTTAEFIVQPVSGAGAYIWTGPPGTLFDSLPSPATIIGAAGLAVDVTIGTQSGSICVQAANTCAVNPPCSASLPVTVLDDSARPVIVADTLVSLPCSDGAIPINVTVTPLANVDFAWSLTDSVGSIVSSTQGLKLLVDSIGQYNLLVTDRLTGCTSTVDIRVVPPILPSNADITLKHIKCFNEKNGGIAINNVQAGTPPFLFSIDDQPFTSYNIVNDLRAGAYELRIQDAVGCEWDSVLVLEQPNELLVQLEQDTVIGLGNMLVLWDSFHVNYPERIARWNLKIPDMGDTVNCKGCLSMPIRSFVYTLEIADSNGCSASDQRTILVDATRNIYIPNIFSPTPEESANNQFGPFGGDDVVRFKTFQIFDRWGQKVHDRTDISKGDQGIYWDGRIRSRLAPAGVYGYIAEVVFKDGFVAIYRGDVALVR